MSDAAAPPSEARCPRCGGAPAPARKPSRANPFLPKSKRLTCSLCGLDFDRGDAPWSRKPRGSKKVGSEGGK
jgi:rubredoxin